MQPEFAPSDFPEVLPDWRAFHVFYHADRDLLLTALYRPFVIEALEKGWIDRFFFVRLGLGGPHLRMRFRLTDPSSDIETAFRDRFHEAAEGFLERHPSEDSLDEETIRGINRSILFQEAGGPKDKIYPDNSIRAVPFKPEWRSYGGPDTMDDSLALFTLSTVFALHFVEHHREATAGRRLAGALRAIAGLAFGFARDDDELITCLEFAAPMWGGNNEALTQRGDEEFERNGAAYTSLLRREVERFLRYEPERCQDDFWHLSEPTRRLGWKIREWSPRRWNVIMLSHIHMTMVRMGMAPAEEVYLGRVLSRASRAVAESSPELWRSFRERLAEHASTPPIGSVDELLPLAYEDLVESPAEFFQRRRDAA